MDLVVRLLGESASYTATMARAEADTNKYDQRLEALTHTMQRQQVASQLSAREAQVLAIADKGASVAAAEYALSVARELDQLDQLAAAEERAAREKQAMAAATRAAAAASAEQQANSALKQIQSLEQERVGLTQGATAAKIYAIEHSGIDKMYQQELVSLVKRNSALADAAAAERESAAATAAAAAAAEQQADSALRQVQSLEQERISLTQGVTAAKIYGIEHSSLDAMYKAELISLVKRNAALADAAALDRKAAADKQASKTATDQQAASAMSQVTALQREKIALTEGATAAKLYDIEQSNLTQSQKDVVTALTLRNEAVAKAAAADRAAAQAAADNLAWIQKTIQAGHEAAQTTQASTIYTKLKEAATRGATDAQINEIYTAHLVEQKNKQLEESFKRRAAAQNQSTQSLAQHGGASRSSLMAMQAMAFGVQDAAQVYGSTGLAGAISASANNLIFMTQMLNPHLAIVTAVVVAGGQFLAVLWPTITGLKNQKEATEELVKSQEDALKLQTSLNQMVREGRRAMEGVKDYQSAKSLASTKESSLKDLQDEEQQIQTQINGQRKLRDERVAIRTEERRMMSWLRARGADVGVVRETVTQKEIEEHNKRIYDQQVKIFEIKQRQAVLEQQLAEARKKESSENVLKRRADAAKANRERDLADWQAAQKAAKEKATKDAAELKAKQAERKRATKAIATFNSQINVDKKSKDDQKRQKLLETLMARKRMLEGWKNASVITAQEAAAGRIAAEQAYFNKRKLLEEDFKKRDQKKALAKRRAMTKKTQAVKTDLRGVETNSQAGFKAIFEATNGGKGGTEAILKETIANGKALVTLVKLYTNYKDDIKKLGVVKTK